MRELKMKVWVNNSEMIGPFDLSQNPAYWAHQLKDGERLLFTGLTDKNGVEIFEGDIVNVNHQGGTPRYETVKFYTNSGYAGLHPFLDTGYHWSSHRCEVVGNIHQHSELLEEQS